MRTSEQKRIIVNGLKPFFKENNIIGKNIWELLYQFDYKIRIYKKDIYKSISSGDGETIIKTEQIFK